MNVDDDIHAEQCHAELQPELFDQGGHGLGAGRRQAGHLFVQLGGEMRRSHQVPVIELFTSHVCTDIHVCRAMPPVLLTAVRSELDSGLDT